MFVARLYTDLRWNDTETLFARLRCFVSIDEETEILHSLRVDFSFRISTVVSIDSCRLRYFEKRSNDLVSVIYIAQSVPRRAPFENNIQNYGFHELKGRATIRSIFSAGTRYDGNNIFTFTLSRLLLDLLDFFFCSNDAPPAFSFIFFQTTRNSSDDRRDKE